MLEFMLKYIPYGQNNYFLWSTQKKNKVLKFKVWRILNFRNLDPYQISWLIFCFKFLPWIEVKFGFYTFIEMFD